MSIMSIMSCILTMPSRASSVSAEMSCDAQALPFFKIHTIAQKSLRRMGLRSTSKSFADLQTCDGQDFDVFDGFDGCLKRSIQSSNLCRFS